MSHTGWISNRGSGGSRRQGKSTRQSVAASRNAPAGRKLEGIVFTGAFFLFTWLALCVQGTTLQSSLAAGAALSIVVTVLVAYLNRHNRRRALEDYERQWYYSKCGDTFLRDHGAGA
ncbi:hypothetical protein JJB79_16350 [Pantoea eucrina]|uniref:Uncharacterized protein n=1 Tax=Pantoea eucrina TaxID=472693 RepID=A0ABS1Z9G0_9GAMM|nr:hypothetical protein [Pantoea eucrina]MBM0748963.1 hypothetical protein [Pantoea eucrina]